MIVIIFLLCSLPKYDTLLFQGIHHSYEENYVKAEEVFLEAIDIVPNNPAGYFFLASLYGLYMSDFSTDSLRDKFYAYVDTTISLSNYQIELGDTSGIIWLWLAGGYGARAFYRIMNRDIILGIQDGISSIKGFHKAIEIDTCLFDAYIGISGYNYFKHRFLSFVPWINNSQWEHEIKLACDGGKYLKYAALAGYALLLNEEERYHDALVIADKLVARFPDSRTQRWIRVKILDALGEWELAKRDYKKLLELVLREQPNNFYNIGYSRIGLANAHFMLGESEECKAQCTRILELPTISNIKRIKAKAWKMLKDLK